ncbi:uncharacterized protein TRIREDRAFT_124246 [Trichoderma reesei QM6a]|uniref:Predicted protein n=1 Tax=Hypocrea jecorina (strain QM6a) TaxID=431241 RepID=G0RX55_HYPJQ|nr:uncharacterized protein TRIREDRAFT_124246 [Trichoderma reesei QM6a]EGR44235.1 predicted protein [Trichoderma reesei QM6a]
MEDQFGGRTDDDLFYDDFEPVESEPVLIQEPQHYYQPDPVASPAPASPNSSVLESVARTSRQEQEAAAPCRRSFVLPLCRQACSKVSACAEVGAYAEASATEEGPSQPSGPPSNAGTGPRDKPRRSSPSQNTAANAEVRAKSGSNPRHKLTEDELAAKMEKMKLLSAEKARKFEMAEQDEKQHAEAYARGMEEARKRRAEEAERRKRGEEERRKLEDERAKNRERKLKAMHIKDGSWDEGKEALAEEEARRGFRGANGGIRGAKSRGGLGGSRFAEAQDVDRFLDDRHRGRGRGDRGRGGNGSANGNGRGRGRGRGSYDGPVGESRPAKQQAKPTMAQAAAASAQAKPTMAQAAAAAAAAPPPLPLPLVVTGGKWDDEMEALDALNQAQAQGKAEAKS